MGWNELEGLYERARAGDERAWDRLETEAVRRLATLLWSRRARPRLRPEEAEVYACDAFEAMALRSKRIATWPQAWTYARKAAVGLARKRLREKKRFRRLASEPALPDPGARRPVEHLEALDEVDALLARLSERDARIGRKVIESVLSGRKLEVPKLARQLGMSVRTVERRLRAIRRAWRRRPGRGEDTGTAGGG